MKEAQSPLGLKLGFKNLNLGSTNWFRPFNKWADPNQQQRVKNFLHPDEQPATFTPKNKELIIASFYSH